MKTEKMHHDVGCIAGGSIPLVPTYVLAKGSKGNPRSIAIHKTLGAHCSVRLLQSELVCCLVGKFLVGKGLLGKNRRLERCRKVVMDTGKEVLVRGRKCRKENHVRRRKCRQAQSTSTPFAPGSQIVIPVPGWNGIPYLLSQALTALLPETLSQA